MKRKSLLQYERYGVLVEAFIQIQHGQLRSQFVSFAQFRRFQRLKNIKNKTSF